MKTIFTAAALSLLAVTAVQASNAPALEGVGQRTIALTNGQDIRDYGSASASATVGAPKEAPVAVLPPRDRVEAGYKAQGVIGQSLFPSTEAKIDSRR